MSDLTLILMAITLIVVALASIIYFGGIKRIKELLGQKNKLPEESGTVRHADESFPIIVEFADMGKRIRYNGCIKNADGTIALFNEHNQVEYTLKESEVYLQISNLYKLLDNPKNGIILRVEPHNYLTTLENEIFAKNMQLAQLQEKYVALSKSYNTVRLIHEQENNQEWHARNKNKRTPSFMPMNKKFGGMQQEGGDMMMGDE